MFRRVGQGLRGNEVRRGLDRLGEPVLRRHVELDGNRRAPRERPQSRAETALGQDRRMDTARQLLQLVERGRELAFDARQLCDEYLPVRSYFPDSRQLEKERHQPLLRAVMEVSLDPEASLVRRLDDPPARGGEL